MQMLLDKFAAMPLSQLLLMRQLYLLGMIASRGAEDLARALTLEPDTLKPRFWNSKRKVGRPPLAWNHCVYAQALMIADGCHARLQDLIRTTGQSAWKQQVRKYLSVRRTAAEASS